MSSEVMAHSDMVQEHLVTNSPDEVKRLVAVPAAWPGPGVVQPLKE